MEQASDPTRHCFEFAGFRLYPSARKLERDGAPVKLGGRAFDLLHLLVKNAGDTVSRQSIWATVWAGAPAGDGSLRFQLVELRKRLGDTEGNRFIATVPGKGYCFVLPVSHGPAAKTRPSEEEPVAPRPLPSRVAREIGRSSELADLHRCVRRRRCVTIVGPGGVGKTTLAVAAAHELATEFNGRVAFVDLGTVTAPSLIASAVASALGISVRQDPMADINALIRKLDTLVVFDCVEHLIEDVAALVQRLLDDAPQLHILVTSREALRLGNERIFPLAPLELPDPALDTSLDDLLANPSAELFVERTKALGCLESFGNEDAPLIGAICRQLDGIPLALELAASRVPSFGLAALSTLLNGKIEHLRGGVRTAARRHQTLTDTIAWSFDLLDGTTKAVLCRLATFAGSFSLAAACFVSAHEDNEVQARLALDDLVSKSLVSATRIGGIVRYRLLDTTRAHLRAITSDQERRTGLSRHAAFYQRQLSADASAALMGGRSAELELIDVPDVRAAMEWFADRAGGEELTPMAVSAAQFLHRLSLLAECRALCEQILKSLSEAARGSRCELELQRLWARSGMYANRNDQEASAALGRAFELATTFDERDIQLSILTDMHLLHVRRAEYIESLEVARRSLTIAASTIGESRGHLAIANLSMGVSLNQLGEFGPAIHYLARSGELAEANYASNRPAISYVMHPNRARVMLAHALWMTGFADQAAELVRSSMDEVLSNVSPLHRAIGLSGISSIPIWRGDWAEAECYIAHLSHVVERHNLGPYKALAKGYSGQVAVGRGDKSGVGLLETALREFEEADYRFFTSPFQISLASGLNMAGQLQRSWDVLDDCEQRAITSGSALYLPEVFRVRGEILSDREPERAHAMFERAVALSAELGAKSFGLRAATGLARNLARSKKPAEAEWALQPLYDAFTEGHDTVDLTRARGQLQDIADMVPELAYLA